MAKKEQKKSKDNNQGTSLRNIFEDIKEHVGTGAKILEKKSNEVFESVKEGVNNVYEAGADQVQNVNEKVQNYTEYQKVQKLQKQESQRRDILIREFGEIILAEYRKHATISKRFLNTKKMETLLKNIGDLDTEIKDKQKVLDKLKS